MARVMIVAGGPFQCPIAKLAHEKGHYVICSNLYEDSPAFRYADVGVVANVLDKERNLQIAREYHPDTVVTEQTDIAVPTVAYIAEQLGLKGIGTEVAKRFTNKYLMRVCTSQAGFPSPKFQLCHTPEEAIDFLREVPKAIIKPVDSQSSRGVHIVSTAEDVRAGFEDCISYSNTDKAILVEEYIEGTEFTVDGLKTPHEYVVTAISEKEHYAHNASIASKLLFSRTNERFDYDKLRQVNTKMVQAMGLPFGLTHAEYKYHDGEFYLIEIAARGGGTRIASDIVPLVSGINSTEVYLNIMTGESDEIVVGPHHDYAILGFFDLKPGKIVAIEGAEEALDLPGVTCLELEVHVGQKIGKAQDDRTRGGHYIVYADTREELLAREQALRNMVKVITE